MLEQQVANAASSSAEGRKWEGLAELRGIAKPGKTPEEVEQAIYKEIEKLQNEPIGERELQKVKNQFAAGNYRRLQSDFALMFQLLVAENNRGWETLNSDPPRFQAVTAQDLQRVAKIYFQPDNRNVLIFYTKKKEAAAASGGAQ